MRHGFRTARIAALIGAGLVAWRIHDCALGGNLGAIVPRQAYRSAQFSGPQLRTAIEDLGLRSVINLRGRNDKPWYHEEVAACAQAGVRHFDITMSGRELPSPNTMLTLLETLRQAPRPLLLHCQGGGDRAGLAAAVYLIECQGAPLDDALAEGLSLWHGYLPLGGSAELTRFFALYRAHAHGKDLEAWVRDDYPAIFRREWSPAEPQPPGSGPPP